MPSATTIYQFENGPLPAAVLCDMDGLLLDTERLSKITFDDLVRDHGITNGDDVFPCLIGRNKAAHLDIFASMLPDGIDAHAFNADWMHRYLTRLDAHIPVKDGVSGFLALCRRLGVPVAVVTSSETAKADDFLTRGGLRDDIAVIIGGDQVDQGKPHPEIYCLAAKTLSQPISDCLALEDSDNGMLAAYHAGARVIRIPDIAPQDPQHTSLNIPLVDRISAVPSALGWPLS